MSIAGLLHSIKSSRSYENQIVHVEEIISRQPEHASIELKPLINYALDRSHYIYYQFCYQNLFTLIKGNNHLPYHELNMIWGTL